VLLAGGKLAAVFGSIFEDDRTESGAPGETHAPRFRIPLLLEKYPMSASDSVIVSAVVQGSAPFKGQPKQQKFVTRQT